MPNRTRLQRATLLAAFAVTLGTTPVLADPVFGNRTDKPDGSSSMTIGRRLPTEWETKVGTDVSLAAPSGSVSADNYTRRGGPDQSSGAVWGSIAMPGLRPLGFDKTSVDARLDAGKDEGKLGATLSRSVPLNQNLSVSLQHSNAVTQSLATAAPAMPATGTSFANVATPAPTWSTDESVRLNIAPTGTAFSAGATSTTADTQWRNKFSIEQTVLGPLKVTTTVEDAGSPASRKSITAGFKRVW